MVMTPFRFTCLLTVMGQSGLRGFRLLLALFALDLGASAFTVGLLLALFALMGAAGGWYGGRWSDRAGCRRPMLWSSLVGVLGFCIPSFFPHISSLFAAAMLVGTAYGVYQVAQTQAVAGLSTPENRSKNLADYSLMLSVTNFSGPLLAGFAIELSGHAGACLWFAGLGLAAVEVQLAGARLLPGSAGESEAAGGSLRQLFGERNLMKILLVGSMVFAAIDVFQFYVPVYAHGLGLSAATVGMIMSCFSAAAFISRICLKWFMTRTSVEVILQRSFLLATAAFVLFPFVENPWALAALSFAYGYGLNVGQPITLILSYDHSPQGRSGQVAGARAAANQIARVVAPVVFGGIGSLAGLLPVFFIGGGMLAWGALMLRSGSLTRNATPGTGGGS